MFIVNYVIATKYSGDNDKAISLLDKHDWSSCSQDFQLAVAVLKEDFDLANEIMISIGSKGVVRKHHYHDWPLFRDFRETEQFQKAYENVFGEPYQEIEEVEQKEAEPEIEKTTDDNEGESDQ